MRNACRIAYIFNYLK